MSPKTEMTRIDAKNSSLICDYDFYSLVAGTFDYRRFNKCQI